MALVRCFYSCYLLTWPADVARDCEIYSSSRPHAASTLMWRRNHCAAVCVPPLPETVQSSCMGPVPHPLPWAPRSQDLTNLDPPGHLPLQPLPPAQKTPQIFRGMNEEWTVPLCLLVSPPLSHMLPFVRLPFAWHSFDFGGARSAAFDLKHGNSSSSGGGGGSSVAGVEQRTKQCG